MIFVLKYRRSTHKLEEVLDFEDSRIDEARRIRKELEMYVAESDPDLEVVLLGAKSLEALKDTHARYFSPDLRDMRRSKIRAELIAAT